MLWTVKIETKMRDRGTPPTSSRTESASDLSRANCIQQFVSIRNIASLQIFLGARIRCFVSQFDGGLPGCQIR